MSKAYERAMGIPTPEEVMAGVEAPEPVNTGSRCWRCNRNRSRVPGEDFMCDPCEAYMTGETDKDPKDFAPINELRRNIHT